jgi:hypothetical protein
MNPNPEVHAERRLVERFFRGESSAEEWKRLVAHLRECVDCSEHYERVRSEANVASGDTSGKVLGSSEVELARRLAFERVHKRRAQRRLAAGGSVLALAAGVALLIAVPRGNTPVADDGFTAKGNEVDSTGAEVLCFDSHNLDAKPVTLSASGDCVPGSLLKLKARALDKIYREVVAVTLGPDGELLKLSRATLEPDAPVTLAGYSKVPERGELAVVFVFSDRPIEDGLLRSAVAARGRDEHGLLPLEGVTGRVAERVIVIGEKKP